MSAGGAMTLRLSPLGAALVLLAGLVLPVHLSLVPSLAAPAVTVNSTDDDPDVLLGDGICDTGQLATDLAAECTLRAALQEANASAVDEVTFAVPSTDTRNVDGIVTIQPGTALPSIDTATLVDARTQPGWDEAAGTPVVVLDGSLAGAAPGLEVTVGPSLVAGFAVHSFGADGIELRGTTDTTVRDNHVGADETGLAAPGNGSAGIRVDAGAGNVVLDNTVGGNASHGVVVDQGPDVVVRGNRIGVGSDDVTALPNGDAGVEVAVPTSSDVRIGGAAAGDGNHIAHNTTQGVTLRTGGLSGVAIMGNSIHGNGGLGIDLGDDGLTANDVGDGDNGPNGLLNTPVPTAAGDDEVQFDLDVPAGTYRIEVFRNPSEGADPLGSGEGEQLVGAGTVTHAGTGAAGFTVSGLTGVTSTDVLSLTATEDLGTGDFGSTSEFSATVVADDDVLVVNDGGDAADASPGDGVCATGATTPSGEPACTLRAALQEANATPLIDTVRIAVPGTGGAPVTITPATALPTVTGSITLDGTTQAGFTADPVVAVDGSALSGDLLTVAGAGSEVRSLALHGAGGSGLAITGDDVRVTDSWIGLLPDGATVDGVGGDGIRVDGAVGVLVDGGRVTGSGGNGISVLGATADDVAVVDTLVWDNAGLGIDLGGDGVTANDAGDADTGPNGLLNAPVISSVTASGGTVTMQVTLDTAAGDVLVQVFTTPRPDPSGTGQGDALVGTATVAHPGGTATHTLTFAGDLTSTFTATATEDLGGGTHGATSEFSATATRPVADDDPGDVPGEVLARAPLSWWRLGEAGGTTAVDSGSLANDGSHTGGPTLGAAGALAGDADTATSHDGTDDVTVAPHDPGYLLDEGTVSLWVNADDLSSTRVPFSKESAGLDTGGHVEVRIEPDGSVVHRLASASAEFEVASAPGAVTAGTWHHLAITFGPRGMELWVDGERVGTGTHTGGWGTTSGGAGNSEPITLGASGATSGDGTATPASSILDGRLDEVAVFGAQLDGAAIAAIAGAAAQHYEVDAGQPLAPTPAGGVLANDHDADGEALTATLVSAPANAAAFSLASDGSFTYTSTGGFVGTDTFTYTATDGVLASEPATVAVTVLPALGDRVIDDSTGNGHDGRPGGAMTSGDQVAGKVGGALDLDGSDDRVVVDNLDVAGSQLTLSAWVDPDTIGTDPVVLAKAVGLADADVRWRLLLADTSATTARAAGSVRTGAGLASALDPGATDVADGWVHLVARYDGSQVVLFVDGVAVATAAHSGSLQPDPSVATGIGATPDGGNAFDGRIDEVRVSHTARSDAWIAATHATQDTPAAAVTVGATQTSAPNGWSTDTSQARTGSASALAPSGVLRSWLTLDGVAEGGLAATAWWRVNTLTGLDLGQGVRAGNAAGSGPVQQDETGLFGASGWDLGQVDGTRSQLVAPPAGEAPAADTWQRVTVRIDQTDGLSATASGFDVPLSGTAAAGIRPTGTVGFRVGELDPTARWWIDDLSVRRYVTPEPTATLRRTELAP